MESGRLKGFSVVPSLVIQRKVTESDVMPGKGVGSRWKDSLTNGVFADSQPPGSNRVGVFDTWG